MATNITIRDIPDEVYAKIKKQALSMDEIQQAIDQGRP